jgi:hypothetical protein
VPHCVLFQITDGRSKTFNWNWTRTEVDLANLTGQGVGIWSDKGVRFDVVFPNGKTCSGTSFEVVPGDYTVTVHPQPDTTSTFWQGEVRNYIYPDCMLGEPIQAPAALAGGNLVAETGEVCWSAPSGDLPEGASVPLCVKFQILDGSAKTFHWTWTEEKVDLANVSGQGVAIWSSGVRFDVVFPNGKTCSGSSFEVVPGDYTVIAHPSGGNTFWQGEVQNSKFPECRS